ncbi:MAG TPA: sulfurtransferase [Myxococcales bacterium]|nr:sulfurtransferase [Myxococcales bacterium]HAN32802.1 sulfurtransferase [Myxococcales bacterium]
MTQDKPLHISPEEAHAMCEAGAMLVDVRSQPEVDGDGGLPNSVHIPIHQVPYQREQFEGKTVVMYCLSGIRSANAAQWLRENGVEDAYNAGGIGQLWELLGS